MYIILWILWVIFNGKLTWEIAIIGAILAGVTQWFLVRYLEVDRNFSKKLIRRFWRYLQYACVLVSEIIQANIAVIKKILEVDKEMESQLISFPVDLSTETARVTLANSITLTPGTITVFLRGKEYVIVCLDKEFADGMGDSRFIRLLTRMEEEYGADK